MEANKFSLYYLINYEIHFKDKITLSIKRVYKMFKK